MCIFHISLIFRSFVCFRPFLETTKGLQVSQAIVLINNNNNNNNNNNSSNSSNNNNNSISNNSNNNVNDSDNMDFDAAGVYPETFLYPDL